MVNILLDAGAAPTAVRGYAAFPIFQPSGAITIGLPYTIGDDDKARCPLCNAVIDDEEIEVEGQTVCLNPGYGFAYGGGIGTYWVCSNEEIDCPWFYKELERIEE